MDKVGHPFESIPTNYGHSNEQCSLVIRSDECQTVAT